MEKRFSRHTGKLMAAAAAAAGFAGFTSTSQHADANLIIDVRATGGSAGVTVTNGKTVGISAIGDVVSFKIFAIITGTDGTTSSDAFQNASGSFTSGSGGLLGNLAALTTAPYNQGASSNGVQFDFDSDGDLDVGKGSTLSSGTGWWEARQAPPNTTGDLVTQVDANTSEVQISTLTFTVGSTTGNALVNFIIRPGTANGIALWTQDGTQTNPSTALQGGWAADGAVTISAVPEPTSIGLLGIASVGLLARRRDKKA